MSQKSTSQKWFDNPLVIAGIIILSLILGYYKSFWIPVITVIVVLIVKNSNKAAEKAKQMESFNRFNIEKFQQFGQTKEEREKNIKRLFDKKDAALSFATWWDFGGWNGQKNVTSSLWFQISRHLAAMEQREREFLKTTLLLFNNEKINARQYSYYLLAFVYGNGKTSIDKWGYKNSYETFKDGPGVVKFYVDKADASVDSAINSLIQKMDVKDKSKMIGGNAWLLEDEIETTIFNGNGDYRLHLGHLEDTGSLLHYSGAGSLITIAPPGSGKTQCFVFPNMLNWKGAAVVLDIKPEIYKATHEWREKNVGKVYKFDPLNPENSNSYNPLAFVRDDPDYIWEDSRFLAEMMIVPSGSAESSFWENLARDVLTSAIAHVSFSNEVNDRPMSKVLDVIYGIGWDEMIISLKTNVLVSSMRRMGTALAEMDKKQRDSVLLTAQANLSVWQGARMEKITSKSDWSPMDLRQGSPTIYICIKASEIDNYLSVLRVILAQHIQMLLDEKELKHDREKISPILFMLDEFPQLKRMPPIEKALNVGAGYGIRLWMFTQSYGQLKEAYPNSEGLLGSCAVRTFMNLPLTDEFTTKISDMLGRKHDAFSNKEEPLVSPRDLAGEDYKNSILILATGTKPVKLKKRFAYQDPEIMDKLSKSIA